MRLWTFSLVFLSLAVLLLLISCVKSVNGEGTAMAGLAISRGCYDADNDGYGRAGNSISACKNSRKVFDCDDTSSSINPSVREVCGNRIDDNCNRRVDEAGCLTLPRPVPLPTAEVCDGRDNDEDGQTDEGCNLCIDYDPANNPTEGGSINVTRNGEVLPLTWSQGNFALPFVDSCFIHGADANGGTSINESTCDNTDSDYPYPASTIVACPSGTICIDPDGISGTTAAYCGSTSTSTCGNGLIESGEICDDGNTADRDACSSTCGCQDTDGGYNVGRFGMTVNSSLWDAIVSGDSCDAYIDYNTPSPEILERVCIGNVEVVERSNCPSGSQCLYGVCESSGACMQQYLYLNARCNGRFREIEYQHSDCSRDWVANSYCPNGCNVATAECIAVSTPPTCTDSDPANNPTVRGTLTITGANGDVLPLASGHVDSCFIQGTNVRGGTIINESICDNAENAYPYFASTIVVCPSGTLCTDPDGVFGLTPAYCSPCFDSDSTDPRNPTASYTTAGFVNTSVGTAGTFTDHCDPEGTDLFENYCDDGVRYEQDFSCNVLGADYRCFTNSQGRAYCGR